MRIRRTSLLLIFGSIALAGLSPTAFGTTGKVSIVSVEPTVLFPRSEPLSQVARLSAINHTASSMACEARVTVEGGGATRVSPVTMDVNLNTVDILVPDIERAASIRVELLQGGEVLATSSLDWSPQRKWKVHVIKSSHEDIGYENYIFKKQKEIADFIDLGREQSSPTSVAGNIQNGRQDSPFHYTLETILFQRNYIEERGEQAWRQIVEEDLKPGHMSLMGAPSGIHSHWMDYEELARLGYPARRETMDRFGLDIRTFMIVDNPSLSWSAAQVLADSGFKYVARWGQGWRSGGNNDYATTKVPAIFWWQGPDGESRVLFTWRLHYAMGFWYGQTGTYRNKLDLAAQSVSDSLQEIESGEVLGPYPYDVLITPEYIDHDIPRFDMRLLPEWREHYAYPEIKVTSPEAFFTYVEEKYGDDLPVLTGDLNNFSSDYSSIDPESQGWKRRASRLLPAAETVAVLAGTADSGFALPLSEVERTYTRMYDYCEHSWPTLPRITDEQLFNAAWVKKQEARRALDATEQTWAQASNAFGGALRSAGEGTIAVFNPLVHGRTDRVIVDGSANGVIDLRSGATVPCEPVGDNKFAFMASDVPALGYALYRIDPNARAGESAAELRAEEFAISNRFYTVRFDPENGSITSIVDRTDGRELVDANAPYLANQLVYVHKNGRESTEGFEYTPGKARHMGSRLGRNEVAFSVEIDDPKLGGRITQTVTLVAGVKRVDIENRLESIDVMWAAAYEDRYRDNIYYAFPFAVEEGQIRAEYPGGVVRPHDDQLRWGSHDFLTVNRWIDVSNSAHGVTLATEAASTFSLGEIRYNQFSINYKPTRPWLFSYAWSNRMAGLLTLHPDDCDATFRYSISSHEGDWNSGAAARHGWDVASPLEAIPVHGNADAPWQEPARSFLAVDAPNVELTVLKTAAQPGRGWVARFVETQGRATEFELDASALGVSRAMLCDMVENDTDRLPVRGGRIRVPINRFGFATVRLTAGKAPGRVDRIRASDVTDSSLRLTWSGRADAFNVYRSADPDAPATAYTLVARTDRPEFADSGLHVATHYHYRVAAVTAENIEGPRSQVLSVKTSSANQSPPAPAHEVGVVRRAHDTLIVYWRKNPEPDVARYRVFRGESAGFTIEGSEPVAELEANDYFLQTFRDTGLKPGTTYYYRIQPVDWADNRQDVSKVVRATTPKEVL